jgi:hypothetical protein
MKDNGNLNAFLRHRQQEVKTLEANRSELSHLLSDLRAHESQRSDLEEPIANSPTVRAERDSLISSLRSLSEQRVSDVSAHYCLYLLESLCDSESRTESLENVYIDAKYGVSPSCNVPLPIPSDSTPLAELYSRLKTELQNAESAFALTRSACAGLRHSLEESRIRFASAAQAIPGRVWSLEAQYQSIDDELGALKQQLQHDCEKTAARRRRFEHRNLLMSRMAEGLAELELPDSLAHQAMKEVQALLIMANTAGADEKLMEAHAKALVKICGQPSQVVPKTPEARKELPELGRSETSEIRAALQLMATRGSPKSTVMRSPEEVKRALADRARHSPGVRTPPQSQVVTPESNR